MATLIKKAAKPPVLLTMKRGDTFAPILRFLRVAPDTGVPDTADIGPFVFGNWNGRAQIRDPDNGQLISPLRLEWVDHDAGVFQLIALTDTDGWTDGNVALELVCDIEFTTDTGDIRSSRTFAVRVEPDVTRDDPADTESAAAAS